MLFLLTLRKRSACLVDCARKGVNLIVKWAPLLTSSAQACCAVEQHALKLMCLWQAEVPRFALIPRSGEGRGTATFHLIGMHIES
jgi:hypothetical protein